MTPDRQTGQTPADAWQTLTDGNDRFVAGQQEHPHQDADRRGRLTAGQNPFAVVLGCSDSRVAAELVFDRGLGDVFVVRTAGHVLDPAVLGSIEYGVEHLGTPVVVVLGHDSCGAVTATVNTFRTGDVPGDFVRDVVERITPSLVADRFDPAGPGDGPALDRAVEAHVRHTARLLVERSRVVRERVEAGRCAVVGAGYRLADGRVRLIEVIGDLGAAGLAVPGLAVAGAGATAGSGAGPGGEASQR